MNRTNNSFFSYGISRAYPYRWFTPVVIIGGIISIVLVSFLNIAASGYELIATSSPDFNATVRDSVWFDSWPTWLASTRATCQSTTLPLQTGLYTNNTALFYTLVSVWRNDADGNKINLGSLVYSNNELQKCNVSTVKMDIESSDTLDAGQIGVSQLGAKVTADVTCMVDNGPTYVQLVTTYDPIPPPGQPTSMFLDTNITSKASLYWGQSVLRLYWPYVLMKYYNENIHLQRPYYKAEITLDRKDKPSNVTGDDEMDLDFLRVQACWLTPLNSTGITHIDRFCDSNTLSVLAEGNTTEKPVPSIWEPMSVLGKAMWFIVLADLGRDDSSMPNILARPELLEYVTQNMSEVNATLSKNWRWGLSNKSISLKPYVAAQDGKDQLGVSPSVLSTNYICQTPKLKSPGTLIVSVLVADLVLMQFIWQIYLLVVDYFFVSRREDLKYCEGCAKVLRQLDKDGVPLTAISHERGFGHASVEDDFGQGISPGLSPSQSLLGRFPGR